jgi:hypothetical protein
VRLAELQVEIRPRTSGQVSAIAARMLQHRPLPLLAACAFYALGTFGLAWLILRVFAWHPVWAFLLVPLLCPIFSPPLTTTVGHLVFTPRVTFGLVARETARRYFGFVALFLLNRLLLLAGLAALVVPGLYLWRASWFLGPIVLLEGADLGTSLRRGRRFAAGFHGHVLAHAANLAALLLYLGLAAATFFHFLVVKVYGLTFTWLANLTLVDSYYSLLALGAFSIAAPFCTLVWFFVYLDVRTRKEGWDLEIAFRSRAAQLERSGAGR